MILTPHILVGATLASKIKFLPLALGLAFLSHYFFDFLPHLEYPIKNIQRKNWNKSFLDFLKVFLDISVGLFLVFILSKNLPLAMAGGFFAILPDGFILLGLILPNRLLKIHYSFHQKIHFPESKKVPLFWGIFSQVLAMFVAIYFLR
ncbi:hypothetical protein KJA17_00125 [Patescibacteria group bacterium]|nr:hypothetical protein [Patescibacteria group bacterium]